MTPEEAANIILDKSRILLDEVNAKIKAAETLIKAQSDEIQRLKIENAELRAKVTKYERVAKAARWWANILNNLHGLWDEQEWNEAKDSLQAALRDLGDK